MVVVAVAVAVPGGEEGLLGTWSPCQKAQMTATACFRLASSFSLLSSLRACSGDGREETRGRRQRQREDESKRETVFCLRSANDTLDKHPCTRTRTPASQPAPSAGRFRAFWPKLERRGKVTSVAPNRRRKGFSGGKRGGFSREQMACNMQLRWKHRGAPPQVCVTAGAACLFHH